MKYGKQLKYIFYYLTLNPIFLTILYIYFISKTMDDIDKIAVGIYSIIWFLFGTWFFLFPIIKNVVIRMMTPYNPKTPDQQVMEAWEQHLKEKEKNDKINN